MTKLFNKREYASRRKVLRKKMTPAEIFLWSKLKNKQLSGLKFRRQYGIGPYVVDFYCPELKLALEVDGDVHGYGQKAAADRDRQKAIESSGARVLRYGNREVLQNINGVLEDILRKAKIDSPPLEKAGKIHHP